MHHTWTALYVDYSSQPYKTVSRAHTNCHVRLEISHVETQKFLSYLKMNVQFCNDLHEN